MQGAARCHKAVDLHKAIDSWGALVQYKSFPFKLLFALRLVFSLAVSCVGLIDVGGLWRPVGNDSGWPKSLACWAWLDGLCSVS